MVYTFRHNSIPFYLPQETAYSQIFMHVLVYHLVHYLVLELTFDLVRSPFGLGYLFNLHQNEIFRDVYELSLCSPSMPAQTKAETGGALTKTAIYTRHGDVG